MDYSTPQYDDAWTHYFPFADYGDKAHFWIKLTYHIARGAFASRVGTASARTYLADVVAANGLKALRDIPSLDRTPYKLLNEEVEPENRARSILRVVETYGYAPASVYPAFDRILWTRPGWLTSEAETLYNHTDYTINQNTQTHTLTIAHNGAITAGARVYLNATAAGTEYPARSDWLTVLGATNTTITVPFFTWRAYYNGNFTGFTLPSANTGGYWVRGRQVFVGGQARPALQDVFTCEKEIAYFDEDAGFPTFSEPFHVEIAGERTDTLKPFSSPTVDAYIANMGTAARLQPQQPDVERFLGPIWRKTTYKLPYQ